MSSYIDMNLFLAQLKTKRTNINLRDAAKQIGDISASSLSRIENGKIPDMEVFLRICDWLETSADNFIQSSEGRNTANTPEVIEAHLKADKYLDDDTAEAIAEMVRRAYELNKRKDVDE